MKKRLFNLVTKLTAITTVAVSLMTFSPARAATPTSIKDTLDRLKISVSATHSLSMTLPAGGITTGNTLTVTYTGFGADFAGTPTVTCGAGTATAGFGTNVLTLTGGATPCTGALTVSPYTGTNPGTAGSKTISLGGTAGITGTFAIAIVDDDQVTVTASVDPSITFDIDTALTDTESAAAYSVPLSTLSSASVKSSGTTINSIWLDLDTNASAGASVTVRNANGASGLKSTSTPADTIPNAAATMAAGTANYGLCVISVAQTTGTLSKAGTYTAGTCAADGATNDVKALSTTDAPIVSTSAPLAGGRARISVNATVSGVTPAHNDYTDTLTFIATGTF